MKKAATKAPSAPPNLGSKRQCPKCATKFYDFGKDEIVCPKCRAEIDPEAMMPAPKAVPEPKRAAKVVETEDEPAIEGAAAASGEEFESVDDLSDDEDDVVEGVEVEDDEESF